MADRNLSQYGLSTKAILNFYRAFDAIGGENHSLLITKDGKRVYEEYCAPYNADTPHSMFSVTKCLVSIAVGFAIEEGLISMDTRILPYFAEYEHKDSPEWDNVTVENLLLMNSNKKFSFLQDMTEDHAKLFMKAGFRKKKGWLYSNNDSHMLAALVEKVTGEHLDDYLDVRLFQPLGLDKPFWEKNKVGVCVGGSGVYLTARQLAAIGECVANEGKFEGKQIIPADYIRRAVQPLAQPAKTYHADGFGYYFWMDQGTYRLEGLFGQFSVVVPEQNTVVTMTAMHPSDYMIAKTFHDELIAKLFERDDTDVEAQLDEYLAERAAKIAAFATPRDTAAEKLTAGKVYHRAGVITGITQGMTGFPNGFLANSIKSSYAQRPYESFDDFSFDFQADELSIAWREEDQQISFKVGMDGEARLTDMPLKGCVYRVWSFGYWKDGKLYVVTRPLNTVATKTFVFDFSKNGMKVGTICAPDFSTFCGYNSIASGTFPDLPVITPILVGLLKMGLLTTKVRVRFKAK